jgi:hypothetical protein
MIERLEDGRWVIERGPEEGGARWPEDGFLFTEAHAGKRFRISCTVKAYGRLPDGTEVSCGETTAYAFARVKRPDELAVSLEAEPEPAGVWQTITMTAKVDSDCVGMPPFTYRWRFGDDQDKVVVRPDRGESDTVHYFYQQLYRYLVRVEVEDSDGRRGSASMWVHVGLAVRLGSPMSMYVPLREYIQEGPDRGLADPNWTPDQIQPCDYLHAGAQYPAQMVCVAVKGQTLPYEYTHQRTYRQIQYPRVDPLWGTMELLPVLQLAGVSLKTGRATAQEHSGGWSDGWSPSGIWWVPNGTYLWPLNARVRNTDTKAYWWNYWTGNAYTLNQTGLRVLRVTAKLGWMESWDLAATTVVEAEANDGSASALLNPTLTWQERRNPCTGGMSILLMGGVPRTSTGEESPAFLNHRYYIQVGAVQAVEEFNEGHFTYAGRWRLHYFLSQSPPLLDTFSCPGDPIQHAWYAERGNPMVLDEERMQMLARIRKRYQSFQSLSNSQEENGWLVRIGWLDYPAFVVPPTNGPFSIERDQSQTPTLKFYTAIAARTAFFPFSYVPVLQTGGWQINFNGTANYDPILGRQYDRADNAGAQTHTPTLQQPETGYGPYNNLIRGRWER